MPRMRVDVPEGYVRLSDLAKDLRMDTVRLRGYLKDAGIKTYQLPYNLRLTLVSVEGARDLRDYLNTPVEVED